MSFFLPTIILRHRKENVKKCSLRGLEKDSCFLFFTYPEAKLPDLSKYFVLSLEGKPLSREDKNSGIFLIDGTWRYSEKMGKTIPFSLPKRSIPPEFRTAYPRKQTDCSDPIRGLASIEALYITYYILGRDTTHLLDHYYWKDGFLEKNRELFSNL